MKAKDTKDLATVMCIKGRMKRDLLPVKGFTPGLMVKYMTESG